MENFTFRSQLLHKRRELAVSLDGLRQDTPARQGRMAEDDQAQAEHEEFISVKRSHIRHETLREVTLALDRLETGDYGVCEQCGSEIAEKRLQAIPWARYCVQCQDSSQREDGFQAKCWSMNSYVPAPWI
ncbi:MAG: TraR/DksA family transcriptional regulator [Acidobacteria bacterium]|nr:TraR/DksA family transcriptional regulator [Acidobacteriota bacterium]